MNNSQYALNKWPAPPDLRAMDEQWDPGFDAERCVVFAKLGPYVKLFERPAKFSKRFYHTLYPLPIEAWPLHEHVSLYDGFCRIAVELTIRFQATVEYVSKNTAELGAINAHIKTVYDDSVRNIIQSTLFNLNDARWVQTGLMKVEQTIALAVNELLLMHDLQAMSVCSLRPAFKEFPELKFKEEAAYLLVLKKSYELTRQKQHEQFLQDQQFEQQKQEQERIRLESLTAANELALLKQAQEADYLKKSLLGQESQQREQFEIEQRMQRDKVDQDIALNELTLTGKYQLIEKQAFFERQLEEKTVDEKIAHEIKVKEKEVAAKIKLYETEKTSWNKSKDLIQTKELKQKQRQKQSQINADIENKAYLYRQQMLLEEQLMREKMKHEEEMKSRK
jgi:hypothetical protein